MQIWAQHANAAPHGRSEHPRWRNWCCTGGSKTRLLCRCYPHSKKRKKRGGEGRACGFGCVQGKGPADRPKLTGLLSSRRERGLRPPPEARLPRPTAPTGFLPFLGLGQGAATAAGSGAPDRIVCWNRYRGGQGEAPCDQIVRVAGVGRRRISWLLEARRERAQVGVEGRQQGSVLREVLLCLRRLAPGLLRFRLGPTNVVLAGSLSPRLRRVCLKKKTTGRSATAPSPPANPFPAPASPASRAPPRPVAAVRSTTPAAPPPAAPWFLARN